MCSIILFCYLVKVWYCTVLYYSVLYIFVVILSHLLCTTPVIVQCIWTVIRIRTDSVMSKMCQMFILLYTFRLYTHTHTHTHTHTCTHTHQHTHTHTHAHTHTHTHTHSRAHTHLIHFRAALRLFVVFKLRTGPLTTPPVPSPDRKKAQELLTNPQPAEEGQGEGQGEGQPLAWKAPRTGKIIRSIHAG